MLVHLLKLPPVDGALASMAEHGVVIRRANPFELTPVRAWVHKRFGPSWADEVSVGLANKPVSVYLALRDGRIVGFGAYECTRRAFFGPTGVAEEERGRGIGGVLLLACLWGLRDLGYVYGIIGGAGPTAFYARAVGAEPIAGSEPGIYTDMLRGPEAMA
ncbi:MAG TPA: GNAT family N-acetyltransferase [Chthonomonadales bacterium]|nr:GNAT family N-acetyltransferase [Chthonomonadales bacterium]